MAADVTTPALPLYHIMCLHFAYFAYCDVTPFLTSRASQPRPTPIVRSFQVLAVFRSFPFRAPAAPAGNGGGTDSLVEETQAPPPAYHTLAREPEEAGEVTATQADPENVGEDARAQPAVRIRLPAEE